MTSGARWVAIILAGALLALSAWRIIAVVQRSGRPLWWRVGVGIILASLLVGIIALVALIGHVAEDHAYTEADYPSGSSEENTFNYCRSGTITSAPIRAIISRSSRTNGVTTTSSAP